MDDLISKAAEETSWSKEELETRWNGSPELIAEDLFRIRSLDTGEIQPLQLFRPYQPQLLNAYFYGDEKIINVYKGRRIGVSFIFCLAMAIDGLVNPDTFYPIVSDTQGQANNRIADISTLFKQARIDIDLVKDNQTELELPNGSTFEAFSGEPDSSRGDDPAKTVFVDEMAFLEDQEGTMRAFMPFIALGKLGKMLQVSTPNTANDLFLKNHKRGSPGGKNGIISIKQPTFKRPDGIDIHKSLFEQDVEPVRPDLSIQTVETERLQDPKGFAQEYLCRPLSEEYQFFTPSTIEEAIQRGSVEDYPNGVGWVPPHDSVVVLGVDIGINSDDTVVSVWEHIGEMKNLRYLEVITDRVLAQQGINPPERRNPSSVATRIGQIYRQSGGDYVVLDKTGPGGGFQSEVDAEIGRGAHGFNFSDRDAVKDMMGDFNYGLHKGLITLLPEQRIEDELNAVVKKQSSEYQKPKFTGKDNSETGKDDVAISLVLGACPPNLNVGAGKSAHIEKKSGSGGAGSDSEPESRYATHYTGAQVSSQGSVGGSSGGKWNDYMRDRNTGYVQRHKR